ncbi:MAG: hypothetical protein GY752_12510 [bacterium]|nr:hypothetical protein [bacterium]MCP4798369.1 hypothetical protein [bacterium]
MKRFILLLTVAVLICMMVVPAAARPKKSTLGIGTYAMIFDYNGIARDDFTGFTIFGSTALSRNLVFRGGIYAAEHTDFSSITDAGVDLQILFGKNLSRRGFKFYAGLNYFSETIEIGDFLENDYSGVGLVLGLGYNFRNMSIDWWGNGRNPDSYNNLLNLDTVGAGSLAVSLRF